MSSKWRILLLIGRVALGAVFMYAGYSKLHFDGAWHLGDYHFFFAMAINSYQMYPLWFVQSSARIVPWVELALGLLAITGVGLRWVASTISLLVVVFMIMLTRASLLGLEINCGCFGYGAQKPTSELARDSGFLVLALAVTIGAFLAHRRRTPARGAVSTSVA
jgi:uncharacterized membrane protein YphA (DoxX/SURF4 family)